MKIEISNKELDDFIKFKKIKNDDPCKKCLTNRTTCCGCPNKKEWQSELAAIKIKNCPFPIDEYIDGMLEIEKINQKIKELEKRKNKLAEFLVEYEKIISIV